MALNHENLQEPPADIETLAIIQTADIGPEPNVQYQPFRGRSVVYDEAHQVVGVQFWKDPQRKVQKLDLRDLSIEGAAEDDIVELVEGIEVEIVKSEPRYKPLRGNEAEEYQRREQINITSPKSNLEAAGQIPRKGVMQPRRPMPDPSRTRRAKESGRRKHS
jgi:hypothetical protein